MQARGVSRMIPSSRGGSAGLLPEADAHVLDLHFVVRGRLDEEVVAGDVLRVDVERLSLARDVEVVLHRLVVDADLQRAAGFLADVVLRVEADRLHRPSVDRDADARLPPAARVAADAAA